MTGLLRAVLPERLPAPTDECRWRSWTAFEHALEQHLARNRGRLKQLAQQR